MSSSVLQNEDLVAEILLGLPAKELSKCTCVSNQWLTFITTPHFVQRYIAHHHRSSSSLLLALTSTLTHPRPTWPLNVQPLTLTPSEAHLSPLTRLNFDFLNAPDMVLNVRQSCNGLLLLERKIITGRQHEKWFVCNPTTKKFFTFMAASDGSSCFLAYDPLKSSHFKLVKVLFRRLKRVALAATDHVSYSFKYEVTVFSSELQRWSEVAVRFHTEEMLNNSQGVYCNGAVHWFSNGEKSVYFDVESERLKTYPMPKQMMIQPRGEYSVGYFGESRGFLHMILPRTMTGLWLEVLELEGDYSGWFVRFKVNLSPIHEVAFPRMNLDRFVRLLRIVRREKEEDSMLVFCVGERVFSCGLDDENAAAFREFREFRRVVKGNAVRYRLVPPFAMFEYFENPFQVSASILLFFSSSSLPTHASPSSSLIFLPPSSTCAPPPATAPQSLSRHLPPPLREQPSLTHLCPSSLEPPPPTAPQSLSHHLPHPSAGNPHPSREPPPTPASHPFPATASSQPPPPCPSRPVPHPPQLHRASPGSSLLPSKPNALRGSCRAMGSALYHPNRVVGSLKHGGRTHAPMERHPNRVVRLHQRPHWTALAQVLCTSSPATFSIPSLFDTYD
ncbi:hypothetical protein Fmac_016354 [Flemingia macrophylla]|uniref:F-box associated beta-propeller type 3 domain-containing protein n=1 Tax=Flemingia macrophylla TaxID=520843 RepID=A0ABD1MH64_9FABA